MPVIARKSSMVFTCGYGSSGTGSPSASQIGSQPSPGFHSTSRSPGTDAAHVGVVLLERRLGLVLFQPVRCEPLRDQIDGHGVLRAGDLVGGRGVGHDLEDRAARAGPPRIGVARREQDDRVRERVDELAPECADRPVDGSGVVGEEVVPVGQIAVDGAVPHRNVLGSAERLDHVVAGRAEQALERELL